MATYRNPAVLAAKAVGTEAGDLVLNREVFDFANTGYKAASIANNDLIQIGVVPAGNKLVPHLCLLQIPILDTNGSPTGDYTLGSANDPDALKGSAAAETAVNLSGEDFILGTADLGAQYDDVPIYLKAVNNFATLQVTGKIVFDVVTRPYDPGVDVDVT